ncbi:MAG TPA: transcriptional regulator [Pyrinomonadaceae bacterium]|nr:transcriptional regulator [Pyrinomonadaceae bacterium]
MAKGSTQRKGRDGAAAATRRGELREVGRATAAANNTAAAIPDERPATSAAELDRLIHERLRLGIVSALAGNASLTFNELKEILQTTDGNLSVHARKLEDAGYVTCEKSFDGRTPKTEFRLTDEGRRALTRYLDHMESIIRKARER